MDLKTLKKRFFNGELRIQLKPSKIYFAVIARGQDDCVFPFDYEGTIKTREAVAILLSTAH